MRALWSEVVLGLSLRDWRDQEKFLSPYQSPMRKVITTIFTTRQSEPVKIGGVLLISPSSEKTFSDRSLTKFHRDGDLWRAVCRQAFTVLVEAPEITAARCQEKKERDRIPRFKSPTKFGGL